MKLTTVLLIATLLQVSAAGLAQKISFVQKDATIKQVFDQVYRQTGYSILWTAQNLQVNKKIDADFHNASLDEVMKQCLDNQPLEYAIEDKTVIIKKKEETLSDKARATLAQVTISGKVQDETGQPLPGVTIRVKDNAKAGTVSNADGRYSIQVPGTSGTLVFSFVGFTPVEKYVSGNMQLNIVLERVKSNLNEVVVVGYGTQRKGDLTGAVSSISEKDIEKVPTATFDMKLQGRIPGALVTQTSAEPGGNVSIRIRGSNSISANNEPLYVLDGYPLPASGEASGFGFGQSSNPLSGINPNDIVSIQVLKDASATAIYGSRGANGVVIITTKRGTEGTAKISFEALTGLNKIINLPLMGTAQQYAQERNDYAIMLGLALPYNGSTPLYPLPQNAGEGTKWVNEILRTGVTQNYQFGVNGGTKTSKYNVSGNYYNESGIVKNSDLKRGTIRLNFDQTISSKFTLSETVNLTNSNNHRIQTGTGGDVRTGDPIILALRGNPVIPVGATATGPYGGTVLDDYDGAFFESPIALVTDKKDITTNEDYFASVRGVYNITPALSFVVNAGATRRYSERDIYFPRTVALGFQFNGQAYVNSYKSTDYVVESYLKYNKTFNKIHKLDITAGTSTQSNTVTTIGTHVSGFPDDILNTNGLQFGTTSYPINTVKTDRNLLSYYGRVNYNLLSRYLFTFTGRADGSTVFAQNNKWSFFPSGAFAWRVSEEPFFPKNQNIISNLKLRTSYGITGNQAISPLGSLSQITSKNYTTSDAVVSGAAITSVGNTDLKWESTEQINLGIDISALSDRVSLSVDVYQKTTRNLLQALQLPTSSGFSSIISNVGAIRNKGLEVDLSVAVLNKSQLKWNSGFNISWNRSKVLDLGVKPYIYGIADGVPAFARNIPVTIITPGQPFPMFFGLVAERLIQKTDFDATGKPTFATFSGEKRPGQWLFKDVNSDGIINDQDRQVIGNPNPDYILGFNNDFAYKNWSLSVFFQGVLGNDILNLNKAFISTGYVNRNKLRSWYDNHWTPENPTNDLNETALGTLQTNLAPGNYYIEDGSYVRLKNVTLSYLVPLKSKLVKSISVYTTATNLLTITKYSGFDPEVGIYGQNNMVPGVDIGGYPRSRFFYFGIKMQL